MRNEELCHACQSHSTMYICQGCENEPTNVTMVLKSPQIERKLMRYVAPQDIKSNPYLTGVDIEFNREVLRTVSAEKIRALLCEY